MKYLGLILFLVAYLVYAAFWCRIALHVLVWAGAARHYRPSPGARPFRRVPAYGIAVADLLFFRRLFISGKMLWLGSWTFHVSFFFIIVRHLRYFLDPVPSCVTILQPAGVVAGYTLPASLVYLILLRLFGRKRYVSKYVSYYNFFLLGTLFLISASGLLMHLFFVPDLVGIKEFLIGIFTFRHKPLPPYPLFIVHFSLFLLLLPYLPTHLFSAPLVVIEAGKREEETRTIMHDE